MSDSKNVLLRSNDNVSPMLVVTHNAAKTAEVQSLVTEQGDGTPFLALTQWTQPLSFRCSLCLLQEICLGLVWGKHCRLIQVWRSSETLKPRRSKPFITDDCSGSYWWRILSELVMCPGSNWLCRSHCSVMKMLVNHSKRCQPAERKKKNSCPDPVTHSLWNKEGGSTGWHLHFWL